MKAAKQELTPIQVFYSRPTPSNAIVLAIADARAYCDPLQPDGDFLKQLHKAKDRCDAYPKLIYAIRNIVANEWDENGATATGKSLRALLRELGEDE